MKGPLDITRELLNHGVPHEVVHLPRRIESAHELAEALGLPAAACVVVTVYDSDAGPGAVAHLSGATLNVGAVARALGARTVLVADATAASLATDFTAALVPPVALPPDLPFVMDAAIGGTEVVYTATGDPGTALKVHGGDLLRVTRARVAALSAAPAIGLPAGPPAVRPAPVEETTPPARASSA